MQIARVITEFDRIGDCARLKSQPAFLSHTDHDGTVGRKHEHRAIKQPLIARQCDRNVRPALRGSPEAMPGNISDGHRQEIDGPKMF
jgi:hypothetical protein